MPVLISAALSQRCVPIRSVSLDAFSGARHAQKRRVTPALACCSVLKSSSGSSQSKLIGGRKEKKSKQQVTDTGVIDAKQKEDKEHNDSFEKYYNKDLDLDEGK